MKGCPVKNCPHRSKTGCKLLPGKSIQRCVRYAYTKLVTARRKKSAKANEDDMSIF